MSLAYVRCAINGFAIKSSAANLEKITESSRHDTGPTVRMEQGNVSSWTWNLLTSS